MSVFGDLETAGISIEGPGREIGFNNPVRFYQGQATKVGNGDIYYVDSSGGSSSNSGKTPGQAMATIDQAINKCTANQGDVIYVLPGHTETITGTTNLICDVAGISIIGLGTGSLRPTITFTTSTTASIHVSAANVTFRNIIFTANYADIAEVFVLTTAKWFTCIDCVFQATASNMNFVWIVDTSTVNNAADGLTFENCQWIEPDTATQSWLDADGDIDQVTFKNCYANLGVNTNDLPVFASVAAGKDLTNLVIQSCVVIRLNDANPLLVVFADTTTTNTGFISDCRVVHRDVAGELLVTASTVIGFAGNYASAAADASGYLLPVVDS